MAEQGLQSAVSRLEAVASRLEALAVKGVGGQASAGGGASDADAESVVQFDILCKDLLAKFLSLSDQIGGDIKPQIELVKEAFAAERQHLVCASKCKKPSQDEEMKLLGTLSKKIEAIQVYTETNRKSKMFNHLATISHSIPALGWVQVAPTPAPFVKDMLDSGIFYSNRVLTEFKKTDPQHCDWAQAWKAVILGLHDYVKMHHTTGLTWNAKGCDVKEYSQSVSTGASKGGPPPPPPPAGGPPPPPPPPPPPMDDLGADSSGGPSSSATSALFASINQGDGVTKGLRKVTDDMKTHKNPALRQGPAPFKSSAPKPPATAPKPGSASKPVASVKPPVLELQGKKWIVENQKDNKNILIEGDMKQTVYAFKCEGSVIQIKNKINSVVLDSCKKTAVVFEDVLSSVEFVNCQSVQGQVTGKLNTLSIDKTDGCQFYLSKDSLEIEIVTAKSSEMNILIPQDDGDFKEFALPEQYKTVYQGDKMVTTATESI